MSGLSRAPPPRRGQQNLLGFMCMSSGQRFSLEQLMVKTLSAAARRRRRWWWVVWRRRRRRRPWLRLPWNAFNKEKFRNGTLLIKKNSGKAFQGSYLGAFGSE